MYEQNDKRWETRKGVKEVKDIVTWVQKRTIYLERGEREQRTQKKEEEKC